MAPTATLIPGSARAAISAAVGCMTYVISRLRYSHDGCGQKAATQAPAGMASSPRRRSQLRPALPSG